MEAEAANFGTWSAINTKLIDELEFQRTQVGRKSFSNLSIDPGAKLDISGANFSLTD